ncbi:MAG TPA: RsiV family protein, partial [Chitinophagaceae bacterium]|nr:RsiV family protein [Chitinophagaceae bacterium]
NDTSGHDGKIRLYPYTYDAESGYESMVLSVSGKTCKGSWQKNEAAKPLPVTATEKTAIPSFDMLYLNGSQQLKPSLKESPEAFYEAGTIWPKLRQGNIVDEGLRSIITESFGETGRVSDMKKILLDLKSKFLKGYMDDYKDVPDSEMVEYPFSYNMEESRWMIVAYQSSRLITLAEWYYTFAGGAHGTSATTFSSLDLTTGKKLHLDQILQPAGIDKLNGLLEKYFRISRGLKKDEDLTEGGLFENKLEYNANFYVTGKGIAFSYAPYEIASFADGQIDVFIPFTELSKDLQPGFKKLL